MLHQRIPTYTLVSALAFCLLPKGWAHQAASPTGAATISASSTYGSHDVSITAHVSRVVPAEHKLAPNGPPGIVPSRIDGRIAWGNVDADPKRWPATQLPELEVRIDAQLQPLPLGAYINTFDPVFEFAGRNQYILHWYDLHTKTLFVSWGVADGGEAAQVILRLVPRTKLICEIYQDGKLSEKLIWVMNSKKTCSWKLVYSWNYFSQQAANRKLNRIISP